MELLGKIPDPCERNSTKLLNLKEKECQRIGERFVQAYHLLATKGSIREFSKANNTDSSRFVMQLPRQVSSLIMYAEEYKARQLKKSTGAEWVEIRKLEFPSAIPGLVLEAWGNTAALRKLREIIRDDIAYASLFTRGNVPVSTPHIQDAYKHCFEWSEGPQTELVFEEYNGPCQSSRAHQQQKHVPRLLKPNCGNYAREMFISYFTDAVKGNLMHHRYDFHPTWGYEICHQLWNILFEQL